MTKEEFYRIIKTEENCMNYLDSLSGCGIDLYDIYITQGKDMFFSWILTDNFESEAVDTICWWLYEYEDKSEPAMWDADENVIPMQTIDDLWEYCKDYLK